jgi:hypothetical protein
MRVCADCGCDISGTHKNREMCDNCSAEKRKERDRARGKTDKRKQKNIDCYIKNKSKRNEYDKNRRKNKRDERYRYTKSWILRNMGRRREISCLIHAYGTSKVDNVTRNVLAIMHLVHKNTLNAETIKFIESGETHRAYE